MLRHTCASGVGNVIHVRVPVDLFDRWFVGWICLDWPEEIILTPAGMRWCRRIGLSEILTWKWNLELEPAGVEIRIATNEFAIRNKMTVTFHGPMHADKFVDSDWNGMEWDGIGWNGMELDGMGWNGIKRNEIGRGLIRNEKGLLLIYEWSMIRVDYLIRIGGLRRDD